MSYNIYVYIIYTTTNLRSETPKCKTVILIKHDNP